MKIVVAYSGGLDTSVLLTWLKETYQAEIVAFCDRTKPKEMMNSSTAVINTTIKKGFRLSLGSHFIGFVGVNSIPR